MQLDILTINRIGQETSSIAKNTSYTNGIGDRTSYTADAIVRKSDLMRAIRACMLLLIRLNDRRAVQ